MTDPADEGSTAGARHAHDGPGDPGPDPASLLRRRVVSESRARSEHEAGRRVGPAHLHDDPDLGASVRELLVLAVLLVGASRLVEGPFVWLLMGLLAGAMALGTLQVMGEADPTGESIGIPVEALILPTLVAIAGIGIVRLIPVGIGLIPALIVVGIAVRQTVSTEVRILLAPHGATPSDRNAIIVQALVVAFAAFVGMAALVPGGLPDLAGTEGTGAPGAAQRLADSDLAILVGADALVAGLLGYRAAALRVATVRDVLWSAATYAATIGIAAGAIRAMEIPRLLGPGLLTLVFYLWDTIHGAPPSRRRDARRVWEAALLAILGAIVVAWTLALRG